MRRAISIGAILAASAVAGPAHASVTIGSTQGATDGCGSSIVNVQDGSPDYVAQSDGVVVSWSYLAGTQTPGVRLRIYRRDTTDATGKSWIARSESTLKPPGAGAGQVGASKLNTFAESPGIPIKSGDHLGLTTDLSGGASSWGCISTASTADLIRQKNPPDAPIGTSASFPGAALNNLKIGVSAVVEPDADGDNFGDESQDSCPTDAAVHSGPCPVDVSIVKSASPNPRVGGSLSYGLSVKNNSTTNPATGVTVVDPLPSGVTFVSASTNQGTCSGTTTVICALGTLTPGQTAGIAIVVRPSSPGALNNTASVTTTASDTDTTNNSSSLLVSVAPPLPVITKFKLKPTSFKASSAGTLVSYTLNTAAKTTFSVQKPAPGIKSGKNCVKPPKKPPAGAKKCTRYVLVGKTFKRTDAKGPRSFHFSKLNGKTLKAGSYRLQAVARNASGAGRAVAKGFKVK
jgi:uncharacterized repeat protein (TIGR01451 family)